MTACANSKAFPMPRRRSAHCAGRCRARRRPWTGVLRRHQIRQRLSASVALRPHRGERRRELPHHQCHRALRQACARKPVFVWIHGGAFVGGSSALYPLDTLAKSGDMVVVSMNYRLGVFGFMPHPSFDKAHNGGYGLEDQRLALALGEAQHRGFRRRPQQHHHCGRIRRRRRRLHACHRTERDARPVQQGDHAERRLRHAAADGRRGQQDRPDGGRSGRLRRCQDRGSPACARSR